MFVILWDYQVASDKRETFVRAYGPGGDWDALFGRAAGFKGLELLADPERPGRFLTIDRWEDQAAFQRFLAELGQDYAEMDDRLQALSTRQTRLGVFAEP